MRVHDEHRLTTRVFYFGGFCLYDTSDRFRLKPAIPCSYWRIRVSRVALTPHTCC